jgi:hypothetical protein
MEGFFVAVRAGYGAVLAQDPAVRPGLGVGKEALLPDGGMSSGSLSHAR